MNKRIFLHVRICNETQCLLFDEENNMIGMLESSKLLYLIAKLKAVIDNPAKINNKNIIIDRDGGMNKTKTVQNMFQKGFSASEIVNQTGINRDTVHQLLVRIKKGKKATL